MSYYSSADDLCSKLALLHAAKQAGNNGLNNNINSILDELLRINAIDKNEYNNFYEALSKLQIEIKKILNNIHWFKHILCLELNLISQRNIHHPFH